MQVGWPTLLALNKQTTTLDVLQKAFAVAITAKLPKHWLKVFHIERKPYMTNKGVGA